MTFKIDSVQVILLVGIVAMVILVIAEAARKARGKNGFRKIGRGGSRRRSR